MVRRSAFTLTELLVVIGIVAVFCGIIAAVLVRARESAKRTVDIIAISASSE